MLTNCIRLSAILILTVIMGCSNQQTRQAETAESAQELTQEERDSARAISENLGLARPLTDKTVIYHILAGDFLGGNGDIAGAAEEYAKAAVISEDLAIIERAALIARQAGTWELLENDARRMLAISGESSEALEFLASAQVNLGQRDNALDTLRSIILLNNTDPENAAAGWRRVGGVLANAENQALSEELQQLLVADNDLADGVEGLFSQSVLAWRTGDLQRSKTLAVAAAEQTDSLEILEWTAQIAHAVDDNATAITYYEKALQIAPGDRDLTLAYAELLRRDGQQQQAFDVLETLGDNPEALFTKAAYYLEDENNALAAAVYQQLVALDNKTPADGAEERSLQIAFYAAQLAEQLAYNDAALDWYTKVTAGDNAILATMRKAALLGRLDQLNEARAQLEPLKNSAEQATVVDAFVMEANILQLADKPAVAVQVLTDGLNRLNNNNDLLYARGLAAAAANNIEVAEQDLRRIIRENPDNAVALNALGYTLTDLTERHEEAKSLIEKALRLNPQDAATLDSMGWVNYQLGDLVSAEDFLQQAYSRDTNPEIAAHLGEVLWQLDKPLQAREVFRAAAEQDAEHVVLNATLKRLGITL